MGLDISAYRGLKAAPEAEIDGDGYPVDYDTFVSCRQHLLDYTEKCFPGRTKGLAAGVYRPEEQHGFRAGSYSGYNFWRDRLAIMAYGKPAKYLWSLWSTAPEPAGPFLELINFSDCEGIVGPEVAKKLAADFAEHRKKAEEFAAALGADGDWWLKTYGDWTRAFWMAADGGAVDFH